MTTSVSCTTSPSTRCGPSNAEPQDLSHQPGLHNTTLSAAIPHQRVRYASGARGSTSGVLQRLVDQDEIAQDEIAEQEIASGPRVQQRGATSPGRQPQGYRGVAAGRAEDRP
jgi:hypothetical protein